MDFIDCLERAVGEIEAIYGFDENLSSGRNEESQFEIISPVELF